MHVEIPSKREHSIIHDAEKNTPFAINRTIVTGARYISTILILATSASYTIPQIRHYQDSDSTIPSPSNWFDTGS